MCNNFPNIKVVKGNAFALLMPLKKRTFESCEPIDEDIDATQLTDLVVKFGGVQYQASTSEDGVQIIIPADIAVGTYSIVLTAMYQGSAIRAAYESAVSIVDYNSQSDAQQYIAGSPIVLDAAYVIGGTLTDAELEALKEEYREKNAQLQQAIEDAEEAKREWEQKAADIDGVAQQGSNPEATNTAILEAVQQGGGTDIAKESTSQQILTKIGNPASGQAATLFGAIGDVALSAQTLQELADAWSAMVENRNKIDGYEFTQGFNVESVSNILFNIGAITGITDNTITHITGSLYDLRQELPNLSYFRADNVTSFSASTFLGIHTSLREIYLSNIETITSQRNFECQQLRILYMPKLISISAQNFINATRLIDLTIGPAYQNISLNTWNPTEALLNNSISLLTDEDIAAGFSNNLEKLLYNIREHIAARITDLTGSAGATFTFSSNVKAAILADAPTLTAFTNKNWTIA